MCCGKDFEYLVKHLGQTFRRESGLLLRVDEEGVVGAAAIVREILIDNKSSGFGNWYLPYRMCRLDARLRVPGIVFVSVCSAPSSSNAPRSTWNRCCS